MLNLPVYAVLIDIIFVGGGNEVSVAALEAQGGQIRTEAVVCIWLLGGTISLS